MITGKKLIRLLLVLAVAAVALVFLSLNTGRKFNGTAVADVWRFQIDGSTNARVQDFSPAGQVLLGGGGLITCLSDDGELVFQFKDPGREPASRLLFGLDGRIYGATHAGEVYCIDSEGVLLWSEKLPGKFGSLSAIQQGQCQGAMIALTTEGNLFAVSGSGDAGLFNPAGEVISGFHAPHSFYHAHEAQLINDVTAVISDVQGRAYLYSVDGDCISEFSCELFGGGYAVRNDEVLLLARNKNLILALDSGGQELWRTDKCLTFLGSMKYDSISSITTLPDNRALVTSQQHVMLLSATGELLWRRRLPADINECLINDDRWIDCVVWEGVGLFNLFSLDQRKAYIVRLDLDGNQQACWEMPPRTWEVYGPGPSGRYYVEQDDERSEYPVYYPVDFMQIRLPDADPA